MIVSPDMLAVIVIVPLLLAVGAVMAVEAIRSHR